MMDRHTCAEALRVPSLVKLCVGHRDSGFVLTCRRQNKYFRNATLTLMPPNFHDAFKRKTVRSNAHAETRKHTQQLPLSVSLASSHQFA